MDKISILPSEIITDILTRVPAESILNCKLVSRTWKNLIQHPSFSKIHTNLHNHYGDSGNLSFVAFAKNYEQLYYFECNENHETLLGRIREISLIPPFKCHILVGSVNGLLCLRGPKERFLICNPITKEYVNLPEPMSKYGYYDRRWSGFGYLPSTDEYKVGLVCYEGRNTVYIMVFTLGSGNGWRNVGRFNLKMDDVSYYNPGIFADGALHWWDPLPKTIHVFDIADEKFGKHLSPPEARCDMFGVLDGFLYCSILYFNKVVNKCCLDIWIHKKKDANCDTKEQTKHQSMDWSKVFTVANQNSIPLAFTKNGGVLCCDSHYPRYFGICYPEASTSTSRIFLRKAFIK